VEEERGLLAALEAAPEDDGNWLVYADWLEERGDLRAEFMRLTAELGRGAVVFDRVKATAARVRELCPALPPDWLARCDRLQGTRSLRFRITKVRPGLDREGLVVISGVVESGALRGWGVSVPVADGLVHDWVQEIRPEVTPFPLLSAGQGPVEITLLLSPLCAATMCGGTIRASAQAELELERKLNMSLPELELSVRTTNCLESEGITTVRDLVIRIDEELFEVRAFGETTLKEVKLKLRKHRLRLGMKLWPRQLPLGPDCDGDDPPVLSLPNDVFL
jgi:uncharacterized protein (TIGR02996 family)